MMMHATMAQKRTLKLDGLAMSPEEQLTQPGINALRFEERLALLLIVRSTAAATGNCCVCSRTRT